MAPFSSFRAVNDWSSARMFYCIFVCPIYRSRLCKAKNARPFTEIRIAPRESCNIITIAFRVVFLSPPTHWFFGLSGIPYWEYLVGSTVGLVPGILLYVLLGAWLSSSGHWISACVVVAGNCYYSSNTLLFT